MSKSEGPQITPQPYATLESLYWDLIGIAVVLERGVERKELSLAPQEKRPTTRMRGGKRYADARYDYLLEFVSQDLGNACHTKTLEVLHINEPLAREILLLVETLTDHIRTEIDVLFIYGDVCDNRGNLNVLLKTFHKSIDELYAKALARFNERVMELAHRVEVELSIAHYKGWPMSSGIDPTENAPASDGVVRRFGLSSRATRVWRHLMKSEERQTYDDIESALTMGRNTVSGALKELDGHKLLDSNRNKGIFPAAKFRTIVETKIEPK